MKRRNLLVALGAGLVAGCSKIGQSDPMQKLFGFLMLHLLLLMLNKPARNVADMVTGGRIDEAA